MSDAGVPAGTHRIVPEPDDTSIEFWSGGAAGQLMIQRCAACHTFLHPPGVRCPECGARELRAEPVSGRGVVHSFTVNHQQWHPGYPTPYVIASVELPEQPGLRVVTNIVGCDPAAVEIGMRVAVVFERLGDVHLPLFAPEAS